MRILFVCTGNICRSPTAEGVVRRLLSNAGLDDTIEVASAGTEGYHIGDQADHRTIRTAAARGYDLSQHAAQRVTLGDFDGYDLIVAMDRGHLRALERMRPAGSAAELRLFLDYAPDLAGTDVPDPYYGSQADFGHALDLVERGAEGLVAALVAARV